MGPELVPAGSLSSPLTEFADKNGFVVALSNRLSTSCILKLLKSCSRCHPGQYLQAQRQSSRASFVTPLYETLSAARRAASYRSKAEGEGGRGF